MLIGITLAVLLVISVFSIFTGNSFVGSDVTTAVDSEAVVNGTTTTFDVINTGTFFLDPTMGLVIVLLVVFGGISLLSLNVLATGLNAAGFKLLAMGLVFSAIWVFLSFLALPLINTVPIFGNMGYIVLTIMYTIGVIQSFGGGGGTE